MTDRIVWLDGQFISASRARISPLDRGLLYGDGLFETMRAEQGAVLRVDRHLGRLRAGLQALRIPLPRPADAELRRVLPALLVKNGLQAGTASVKLLVTRGEVPGHGLPAPVHPTVLALADRWTPPAPQAYADGISLHVLRAEGAGGIGSLKALAYLRLLAARQSALDAGAEEALLVDHEGRCVETAAGSLIVLLRDEWVRVTHPAQLPGVTAAAVVELLAARGLRVASREVALAELRGAAAAWVTGALTGIMPVRALDGAALADRRAALADELRRALAARLDDAGPGV